MNYEKEQKSIQELIVHLSCYLHHNRTLEYMRSELLEVSPEYVRNATFALSLMEGTKENAKKQIVQLLPVIAEIMKHDGEIRGDEYRESLQSRNESLQDRNRFCKHCRSEFEPTNKKQVFCSNKCKVAHHRGSLDTHN